MAKESTLKNMALCLFLVCLVCAAILGGAYVLTKDAIDASAMAKTNDAIAQVIPDFDNTPSKEKFEIDVNGTVRIVYPAKKGGDIVGYAIETSTSKGFGGAIVMMVGFDNQGNILGVSVISHAETPGLGSKMTEPSFYEQFVGKNPAWFRLDVKKNGGDVDAITASTITSVAYCDAVANAYAAFQEVTK